MHKKLLPAIISVLSFGGMCSCFLTAYATTADDVAAVARSYGYSEEDIQAGYNEYYANPEAYPSEILDKAIAKLHEAGQQIITTGQQVPPQAQVTTTTVAPGGNDDPGTPVSGGIVVTMKDGSTFTRISKEEFIAMTYDQKMEYIRSFTPEQQQAIIDNLSPEEYRSLMKQTPADQKLQIVNTLSEAANAMGINITVDEITDDSLTIAMRNDKGELVNVSTAGAKVEDTGYDRRFLFASAFSLIAVGLSSVLCILRRIKRDEVES